MSNPSPQARGDSETLTGKVIGAFYDLYCEVGPGHAEKIYHHGIGVAFQYHGIRYTREVRYPVIYRGVEIGSYRADLVVEDTLLVELKCADAIARSHIRQVLYYLKASQLKLGLVLNFGPQPSIKRVIR